MWPHLESYINTMLALVNSTNCPENTLSDVLILPSHRSDVPVLQSDWHQWYLTETKAPAHVTHRCGSWALQRFKCPGCAVIEWCTSSDPAGWINPMFLPQSLEFNSALIRLSKAQQTAAFTRVQRVTIWVHYITSFKTLCWFLISEASSFFTDTCFIISV